MAKRPKKAGPTVDRALLVVAMISLAAFIIILVDPKDGPPWHGIDVAASEWAPTVQGGPIETFAIFIGASYNYIMLATIFAFQLSCLWYRRFMKDTIFFSLALFLCVILIEAIKVSVGRPRPEDMIVDDIGYSFPSGHATMSIVFFGLLLHLLWKRVRSTGIRAAAVTLSIVAIILLGLDRIYLNAHWASDVAGGYALGTCLLATALMLRKTGGARKAAASSK